MTDTKVRTEESHEVRKKRRKKILAEVFDDCELEAVDKLDVDGNIVGEIVRVRKAIWGKQTTVAYIEYCVTRGQRFDEIHVPFAPMEPLALDVLAKFGEANLLKISYDAPEIVVVVHYEKDQVKPDDEYRTAVQVSGRVQATRAQMAKLEKELGEKEREKERVEE